MGFGQCGGLPRTADWQRRHIGDLAVPINPSDFLVFQGRFGATRSPLLAKAGGEALGQVRAVGPGVVHVRLGDRILALHGGRGNWWQQALADAHRVSFLPRDANPLQLAMLGVNPTTALHLLTRFLALRPGDWVAQNAGTPAVAQCVIRLAAARPGRRGKVLLLPNPHLLAGITPATLG
jgi:NADPH:quinone reductase-like Zn-dependent oxidoreductase